MPSRRSRRGLLCAALLALSGLSPGGGRAAELEAPEQAIKAAYLFNFALYTEWPERAADGMVICAIGRDGLGTALDALAGKSLRGRVVSVRRLAADADPAACHLLYLGALAPPQRTRLAAALQGLPLLSVADAGEGDAPRPMVSLAREGGRVVFDVDLGAARAAGLVLSSKLLRLARAVR